MNNSIYIASSPWFVGIAILVHGTILAALWLAHLPWWLVTLCSLILLFECRPIIKLHGLRQHKNAVTILRQDCDKWQYQLKSGRTYKGDLVHEKSFVSNYVLILFMQHINGGRYIVIPRDSLSKHNYRLLSMRLNCSI